MGFRPGQHGVDGFYWPSSLAYPRGKFGSDGTQHTGNRIFIGNESSERAITFKAFLDDFSYKITKNTEDIQINTFGLRKQIIENHTTINISITLNVPAHSFNEARNNLAKIVELQKMIAPSEYVQKGESVNDTSVNLNVFFKNLLNSGEYFEKIPELNSYSDLKRYGMPAYCLSVKYDPDLSMGFFDAPDNPNDKYLYPKNIKLNLELGLLHEHKVNDKYYIQGFTNRGIYKHDDAVYTPFNVATRNNFGEPNTDIIKQKDNIYQSTLNKINNPRTGFVFISNNIETNEGKKTATNNKIYAVDSIYKRKRYVMFSNFIESFSRDVKFEKIDLTDESEDFSSGYSSSKYSSVSYELSFGVAASSVDESIKNLGKLQTLSRLVAKSTNSKWNKSTLEGVTDDIGSVSYPYENNLTNLKIYVPGMIEKPDAARTLSGTSHAVGFKNGLDLTIINCDIKMNMDMGFFERNGKLYPKSFSITLSMVQKDMSLNANFYTKTVRGKTRNSLNDESSLLYPFNRKYTKIAK